MRILAFAVRPDERDAIEKYASMLDLDIKCIFANLDLDNVVETKGYEAITILGNCNASRDVLVKLKENGVKYIASRSAGYNNVDMDAIRELGLRFSNATYSPNCVADFTVMLVLMSIRNMKAIMKRTEIHDYSLPGIQGKEMHNLTFGIIGTGRIGCITARNLAGFNGKIIGHDLYENDSIKDVLTYVSLDTLLAEADVICLHAPLIDSTQHIINKQNLAKTKKGVVIVNAARGELINTDDLIEYIENGHIGACGLDVLEGELGIFHVNHRLSTLTNHNLSILERHKNVIVTPHTAFYTDQAVEDMVEVGLRSLVSFVKNNTSDWEIK